MSDDASTHGDLEVLGTTPVPPRPRPRGPLLLGALLLMSLVAGVGASGAAALHRHDADRSPGRTSTAAEAGSAASRSGTATAALTAPGPAGGAVVITPAGARAVLTAMWADREQALTTRNAARVRTLESGAAEADDLARVACDCLERTSPGPIVAQAVFVSRQTAYPASFLAEVETHEIRPADGERIGYRDYLVLQRSGPGAPWKVVLETWFGDFAVDAVVPGSDGFVPAPTAAERALAETMPARLASYRNAALKTGQVPATIWFGSGDWTDGWDRTIAAVPDGTTLPSGLVRYLHYTAPAHEPIFVVRTGDETLACGLVHRAVRYVAHAGLVPKQDAARKNYGPQVAPGDYQEIDESSTMQTCFYLQDGAGGRESDVMGGDSIASTAYGVTSRS